MVTPELLVKSMATPNRIEDQNSSPEELMSAAEPSSSVVGCLCSEVTGKDLSMFALPYSSYGISSG
jgi:hypothetical protein